MSESETEVVKSTNNNLNAKATRKARIRAENQRRETIQSKSKYSLDPKHNKLAKDKFLNGINLLASSSTSPTKTSRKERSGQSNPSDSFNSPISMPQSASQSKTTSQKSQPDHPQALAAINSPSILLQADQQNETSFKSGSGHSRSSNAIKSPISLLQPEKQIKSKNHSGQSKSASNFKSPIPMLRLEDLPNSTQNFTPVSSQQYQTNPRTSKRDLDKTLASNSSLSKKPRFDLSVEDSEYEDEDEDLNDFEADDDNLSGEEYQNEIDSQEGVDDASNENGEAVEDPLNNDDDTETPHEEREGYRPDIEVLDIEDVVTLPVKAYDDLVKRIDAIGQNNFAMYQVSITFYFFL